MVGTVRDVNGIVLEAGKAASPVTNKIAQKPSYTKDAKDFFIIPIENETDFRYAYKIDSEKLGAYLYIDAENGDTLKISPYIYDVQAKVTTNTIYSGRQKLTLERTGQWIEYYIDQPHVVTINSTNIDFSADDAELYNSQISSGNPYFEMEKDSLSSYLTSVTFHIKDNSWWADLEEGTTMPELYLKIFNSSNVLVYQSQICDEWKYLDITFNPMLLLDGDTYTIKIYDQDLISDDYGGGFTISSQTKGIGTLSLNNFDITINVTGNPIRDVHWGMEKTLAFYKYVLYRNSYDGNGATVYQFVNPFMPKKLPNQAFAISQSPYCMVYGFGDGVKNGPLVALDVMAHEFSHMVTAHNLCNGLDYNGESGALNEGFSDIFGILVEGYTLGQYDWTIGEKYELQHPFTRSFINPKLGNPSQPDTYGKGPWKDPNSSDDHGGVHYNSGILNHWFYLLCQGGSGVNDNQQSYKVQGVGIDEATKITYNTWMNRLQYKSTFADARESFIKEVIVRHGKGSQEHQSVVNAWYAVGVGEPYIEEPDNYVIVVQRDAASNWFYMTSDLGTATQKRYQAVDAGTTSLTNVNTSNLDSKYYWSIEGDKLKTAAGYSAWTSGNSATLDDIGKNLSIEKQADGTYIFSFVDGENARRLALNKDTRYNYFAYYKGSDQIYNLTLIKEGETWKPTDVELVPNQQQATKLLRNNQILILRGDRTYTLTGQEIK